MHKKILKSFFFLFLSQALQAQVNPQEGSFNWNTLDEWRFSAKRSISLERSYSSRSTHRGLLGLGWCSELEWSLIITPGSALLLKCDEPVALNSSDLKRKNGRLVLRRNGRTWFFNQEGRLEEIEVSKSRWLIAHNLAGQAVRIQGRPQELLTLLYANLSNTLLRIQAGSTETTYQYDQGMLIRSLGRTREDYRYDSDANLTSVQKEKKTVVTINYDQKRDLVIETHITGGCTTHFSYRTQDFSDRVRDEVTSQQRCSGRAPANEAVSFEYIKTTGHRVQLKRAAGFSPKELQ